MGTSSQDGGLDLVAPFRALNDKLLRRRASVYPRHHCIVTSADECPRLNALVDSLTHQEIRELQSAIEQVDFHRDIIAKLPLELNRIILQYLPLDQIFQAQRVSSTWRKILSSAQILEPLLRNWYPKFDAERNLQISSGTSAESVAAIKAEQIHAYRTGHAFKYARYEWGRDSENMELYRVAYADGIMAWVDPSDLGSVKSLDLRTGQERSFLPEGRIQIDAIAISSSMIAALGSGKCYVWTLTAGDSYCLLFPSTSRGAIAVSSGSLAIVHCHWYEGFSRVEVVTWTLKDQRTSSFFVAFSPVGPTYTIMLDNSGESLILCERIRNPLKDGVVHFHYTHASLAGDIITEGVIEAPNLRDFLDCSEGIVPKTSDGQAVIWSYAKSQPAEGAFSIVLLICYNLRKDRLEVRKEVVKGLRMNSNWRTNLVFRKNIAYFLDYEEIPQTYLSRKQDCRIWRVGCRALRVINFEDSSCNKARMSFPASTHGVDLQREEEMEMRLLGDETFIVAIYLEGFSAWCFDANARMVNESTVYNEERKNSIERRLLTKRRGDNSSSDDSFLTSTRSSL